MKKFLYRLFLLLIIFSPSIAKAASSWVAVTGNTYVEINDKVTVNFKYVMDELTKSEIDKGMFSLAFELVFDDTILTPVSLYTRSGWSAEIDKTTDNKYYLISAVEEKTLENSCDGILLCGPIDFDVTFALNETQKEEVEIKTGEYLAMFMPINYESLTEITTDDITMKTGTIEESLIITVKPSTHEKTNVKSIVKNSNITSQNIKNEVKNSTTSDSNNNETESQKFNNNLSKLEIAGYEIDFDKYKKIYNIEVPEEVNTLNVYADTEDKSATFTVKGADNLQENNNKVLIEVTSADGNKKTYVVNVKKEDKVDIETKANFNLDEQGLKYAGYFLIVVAVLGTISFIVIKIRDRMIESKIDKL